MVLGYCSLIDRFLPADVKCIYNAMIYARINLAANSDTQMLEGWKCLSTPDPILLDLIYLRYCRYKKFQSYMPIFTSEYFDPNNDVIGYYDGDNLIAFSLMRRYDTENVEAIQFAWNYENPKLSLGIKSLRHECALYRDKGFKYLYLGEADEYKSHISGFEIMRTV